MVSIKKYLVPLNDQLQRVHITCAGIRVIQHGVVLDDLSYVMKVSKMALVR